MDAVSTGADDLSAAKDWFERFRSGDECAVEELFARYSQGLYYLAMKIVRKEYEAEDIVMVSITKAWQHRTEFQSSCNLHNWLKVTVKNDGLSKLRRGRTEAEYLAELRRLIGTAEGEEGALDFELIRMGAMDQVMGELRQLSALQQNILILHYFGGKSLFEIAQILNLTRGNVYTNKHRAIQELRERLGDDFIKKISER
jgi:RNA polymerase sigma factor (sigma-70 family)